MEKWASKWLEMHSQRHRFLFIPGRGPTPALILFPHSWLAPISSKLRLSANCSFRSKEHYLYIVMSNYYSEISLIYYILGLK